MRFFSEIPSRISGDTAPCLPSAHAQLVFRSCPPAPPPPSGPLRRQMMRARAEAPRPPKLSRRAAAPPPLRHRSTLRVGHVGAPGPPLQIVERRRRRLPHRARCLVCLLAPEAPPHKTHAVDDILRSWLNHKTRAHHQRRVECSRGCREAFHVHDATLVLS